MTGMAALQLVLGAILIGFGIARRRSFGLGLVILGAMNTSSAVWVLRPNIGVSPRLALLSVFFVLLATTAKRELWRHMRIEFVLTVAAILAIAALQLFIPMSSRFQAPVLVLLVLLYIGLLTAFCVRTIPKLFHAAGSR